MLVIDYTPLSTAVNEAYRKLPKDQIDWNYMMESAYYAFEALMTYQVYDPSISVIEVENFTAPLPIGVKYIDQIFYLDATEEIDVEEIRTIIMNQDTNITTYNILDFTNDANAIWQPLRLSPSVWSRSVIIPNSPTIACLSEHTYTVGKNRCLITSFETGFIALAGLSYPTCEGEILIPNTRNVINAIANYLFAEYFQAREFMGIQNAPQEEMKYRQRWEALAGKCRGELMLKSIDELENFRTQMQRLGMHNETYNNSFSNLNSQENLKF